MTAEPIYPRWILDLLEADRDRTVFEHAARTVTAGELLATIRRVGAGLRASGIGAADGVAVLVGVSPEAFATTIAAHAVGARVVGVRQGLPAGHLRHILGGGISVLIVDASTATAELRAAARDIPLLAVGRVPGLVDLTATPEDGAGAELGGRPDDIARITYTSGSTGDPKGCAQTYRALTAGWAPCPWRWPEAIRDFAAGMGRFLVFGSLSNLVMMDYSVLALAAGGTLVVADLPGPQPFFPSAIARYRATASVITVPRLYRMVDSQRVRPIRLDTLRRLMVSGSPVDPGRLAQALEVLGPVVYNGYGQTEAGLLAMVTPTELAASPAALTSVGRPPPEVDLEVRAADGRPVPAGVDGELFVRTPSQAGGVLGRSGGDRRGVRRRLGAHQGSRAPGRRWISASGRPDPGGDHRERQPLLSRADRAGHGGPSGYRGSLCRRGSG
jgi:fatty-acyl-CoA synthase